MQLPLVATDSVFWTSDWKPTPAAEVREWLQSATSAEHWVLDGNFDGERASYWARADLAVWLDYPRSTTVWRVLKRNFRWLLSREPIWGGNRMTLSRAVGGVRHA